MDRIEKLKEYLLQMPADSFLRHALALEYIRIGDDEKARQQFTGLLAENPQYVASYYHLGKLLEKAGEQEEALKVYEKGMEEARHAADNHAYNELQSAYEDLAY
jgi:Tfp pilus assembly protein PilF